MTIGRNNRKELEISSSSRDWKKRLGRNLKGCQLIKYLELIKNRPES